MTEQVSPALPGRDEELGALRRLDEQARKLERHAGGPSIEKLIIKELDRWYAYGGRSMLGWEPPPRDSVEEQAQNRKCQDGPRDAANRQKSGLSAVGTAASFSVLYLCGFSAQACSGHSRKTRR